MCVSTHTVCWYRCCDNISLVLLCPDCGKCPPWGRAASGSCHHHILRLQHRVLAVSFLDTFLPNAWETSVPSLPSWICEIYLQIFFLLSHSCVPSGLSSLLKMHAWVLTHFLSPHLGAFFTKPILKHHVLLSSPFFDYAS